MTTKTTRLFIRVTDEEHDRANDVARGMGLRSISEAVRVLLERASQAQSQAPLQPTEQNQHGHPSI